ncbi:gluconate 2-dehydrogenase subunit 3 family protein [Phenylobacterium sp.]|uniref:gluconate 2-dehydrogenase subunit 3 family protein n=1 Tax=Phenylobacterium sp. TaxID=1871053 RepID=UPI002736CD88|nr:gluconate 2-dehydrogenase subunit 3 family protein [Phenylobacterium sp.]MDP3852482.1 gluconate 2-dehydrogenase subunit 3 family protein [Phenylobacterium sp.]
MGEDKRVRMTRREAALTFGALWTALVIPAEVVAQIATTLTWTPKALSPGQARVLEVVAELIVPATDTPGAREAGVPQFVDRAVSDFCSPADAQTIRTGLDRIDADARAAHGAAFAALQPDQQTALLRRYDAEGKAPRTPVAAVGRGETETGLSNQPSPAVEAPKGPPFFPMLRDLVTVGYFTSELGATQAVRYDAVPGAYKGCVPLSEIGRAWAT